MTEIERIDDQIRRAYKGKAWHGPSLLEVLEGITAEQAARRGPNAHSIWEIVNHVSAWTAAVTARLRGDAVDEPAEGDWPSMADTSEIAWKAALERLESNYQGLRKQIAGLDTARLDDSGGGRPISHYINLHGTVQHYVYHAGQIALLKKM